MSRCGKVIFIGNLPGDIRKREVEDLFYKYGPIVDINLRIPPNPPAYAYVEFEDARDAEEAMLGRDRYKFDGERLRVEMAHFGHGGPAARECPSGGRGSGDVARRSKYRVMVTDLPSSASWKDLKDHMRKAGDVCFSHVYRKAGGTVGVVDYTNNYDKLYAIKKLDSSEFRNAFSRVYIRVKKYDSKRSLPRRKRRSPSRSYTKSRSRSPRSPGKKSTRRSLSRSVSRSHSRSRSPDASAGKKAGSASPKERNPRRDRSVSRSPSPVKSE